MDSQALADLILADLESIVARTREAYLERVPRLREVPEATFDAVIEATRRTMRQFCRYYLEGTLDREGWTAVRDATLERAGEVFSHAEIVAIVDVAHSIGVETVAGLAARHPELTQAELAKVTKAMDRYVTELGEQEDRLRRLASPDRLDAVLGALEDEGADLQ
jgi:hypothetical protein